MVSCNSRQPWINCYIKQLSRRKQRCYNQVKISNSPSEWAYHKFLKKEMQKECRKAHNSYVDKMLFDPFVGGKKNFCIEITIVFPCYRKMALHILKM